MLQTTIETSGSSARSTLAAIECGARRLEELPPVSQGGLETGTFRPLVPGVDEHDAFLDRRFRARLRVEGREPALRVGGMRVDEDLAVLRQPRRVVPARHYATEERIR